MRDDLSDFDGTPEEFRHLAEAMRSVRAWMKADSGWGILGPEVDPAPPMSTEKEHTDVTPSPSSNKRRYPINAAGKKSHHVTTSTHVCKWDGCQTVIGGNWLRCPEHVRMWRQNYRQRRNEKLASA